MKNLTLFISALLISAIVVAQTPQSFSYQAVVRNSADELIVNTTVGMQITILQTSTTGTLVYTETQTPTTNENGLLSVVIGGGTSFEFIDWSAGVFFVKTEIDPAGGTDYTITGITQLLSVPYALHAATVASINELDPVFEVSPAGAITVTNIDSWNNKLDAETQSLEDVLTIGNSANMLIKDVINPVDDQDAATKAYVDAIYLDLKLDIYAEIGVSDIEGNHYSAVRIGDQVWIAENLKTTKFNDGSDIEVVIDPSDWSNWDISGMCWFNNDQTTYEPTFGALYNWHAVNTSILCPQGWHVPSSSEWDELVSFLGGETIAGGALKEIGITYWGSPNVGATNSSGFSARACGRRESSSGSFVEDTEVGLFWTSTGVDTQTAYENSLYPEGTMVQTLEVPKNQGNSVRCLKD